MQSILCCYYYVNQGRIQTSWLQGVVEMCFWVSIFVGTCVLYEFRFQIFCEENCTSYLSTAEFVPPLNPFSKYGLDKFVGLDPGVSCKPPTLFCFKSFRPIMTIVTTQTAQFILGDVLNTSLKAVCAHEMSLHSYVKRLGFPITLVFVLISQRHDLSP